MQKLSRNDLMSLEGYAEARAGFRSRVMSHKKSRTLFLGPNVSLHFEDRLTIQYQIQEMLRIERIFETEGIEEELASYNPLIPDGNNLKATMMIEFPDAGERKTKLAQLIGVEDRVWVKVSGHDAVYAVADEDMDRENEEKTSSVHFLRFELTDEMIGDAKSGAPWAVGIDHDYYRHESDPLPDETRESLVADLSQVEH